jgi:hexosaminidase
MIDTARHFLTMDTIKTIIDGMSYDKLNVLHVHWIDAQSIPIVVNKFPLFGEKARWHKSMYYTQDDMREVVDYCFKRGIVVVPEFDLPGHAYVWGNSYPEARSTCSQFKPPVNINNFPIQPANNITYDIIEAMLGDMSSIFTNDIIHLGGDELVLSCWQNDETVKKFLQQRPDIKNMYDLWGYFQSRLEPLYRQNKKRMICWEELLLNLHTNFYSVPKDTIVQVWELIDHLQKVVEDKGYQAVLSAGFYLDKQKPDPSMRDRHLWVDVWEDMYLVDPFKNITTEAGRNRVLGIEACQWGEQVDISQITNRIWARASGVAERAWSPATIVDTVKARTRLINHRCQVFAKRGIMTTPIRPDYCPYVQPMKRYNHDKLVLPQVVRK